MTATFQPSGVREDEIPQFEYPIGDNWSAVMINHHQAGIITTLNQSRRWSGQNSIST
jgi:hypothetical protein